MIRYIDVCSGISAPTMAWKPLGWEAACFAEIELAPRAVLAHHYPNVPLRGDFTEIEGTEYGPVDLLVGGTPCQSFSIAGLRGGLGDDRGNLALEFARLADRARPRWVVWENVPGVLSSNGGRDFGSILGALGELGYGVAYRVLDAQHFGVPQRRRRVFVVGYLGDWRRAAAVLFERHSLSGHPAPRREAGQGTAWGAVRSVALRGREDGGTAELGDDLGNTLRASSGGGDKPHVMIAHALRAEGFDASEDGTGRGTPLVPVAFVQNSRDEVRLFGEDGQTVGALAAEAGMKQQCYVAFDATTETMYGVTHADAAQADPDQALRALRDAVGEKAYSEWCAGILAAFQSPEILRSKMYGRSIRWARNDWRELGDDALSCPQDGAAWPMLALWQAGRLGRSPRGWEPPEQLARELVAHLSKLPHQRASAARFLLGLWRASEGLGLLREALSALQEAWRPAGGEGQSARLTSAVRRLTPIECERLMGFPDDFTLVPHRGKSMADGPRYKMLGNSMAVPVLRWIGERIQMVEGIAA